jgi:WD40 repeat protein/serine/threonine protein kinase
VTRADGYALDVRAHQTDVGRFEQMALDGRRLLQSDPQHAAGLLQDALDLWRGPALADFADEPFAHLEIERLEELRLSALEDRIEADLALGRHATVVVELEKLTGEHPLRERLCSQLMVALYRSDRQAEALGAFQRLRTQLIEELGLDPSPHLQDLEEQILLQAADLQVPLSEQPRPLRGYELRSRLGEGAFGVVWQAAQPSIGRKVAIKAIRPEYSNRPEFVRGFEAEARLIASLEHPHIVPVFDFWRDPDGAYLVMRLMEGSLFDHLAGRTWDSARAFRAIEQIGSALAYAHLRGLVHGDLHPGNVLTDADGNAYLSDFGLAAHPAVATTTPPEAYSSPEQRRGEPVGPTSDVYGLARLVFFLLTGTPPGELPLPSLRAAHPDLPDQVDRVLQRATSAEPADRYADAGAFVAALVTAVGGPEPVEEEPRNPYKGVRPFEVSDASDFFGRDALVDELATAVASHRLVTVVGPSGSGKSSLLRAGLIPALRSGRLPDSDQWLITQMRPGPDPFSAMAEAFLRVAVDPVPDLGARLRDPTALGDIVEQLLPATSELVLIVDQFEELFASCPAEPERRRFMDALRGLVVSSERVQLVVAVRADFYGLGLQYQPFGELVRRAVVSVVPPGPDELTQMIRRPAERVGVAVAPEVVTTIVGEVAGQPGSLPLMEYALTRTFEARREGGLTIDAYRRSGGVGGALARWPEQIYRELTAEEGEAAEHIFLHLVAVDTTGDTVTRRRVPLPELSELGLPNAAVANVVERFGAARLVTFDRDPRTRTPTVEVAHEALLRQWARLRSWIDEQREQLILQQRFRGVVAEWEGADRDPEFLLQGGRLRQFDGWAAESDLPLTHAEHDFLSESRSLDEAKQAKRRRLRLLIGAALAVLAVVASVFGVVALMQRERAEEQAAMARDSQAEAEDQAELAHTRRLAASAIATLDTDPELSILLALEAVETSRAVDGTILREAEEALHRAVSSNRLVSVAPAEMWGRSLTFAPDGDAAYVGGFLSGDRVAVPSGEVEAELPFPIAVIENAGVDGEWLAVADFDGGLTIRDRVSLDEVLALEGHAGWTTDLNASADGMMLASINPDDRLAIVWDLGLREQIVAFPLDCSAEDCPRQVSLSDDGERIAFGSAIYAVASGEPMVSWSEGNVVDIVEELGAAVLVENNAAHLVDTTTGEVIETLSHRADVMAVDAGADGRRIATGSRDGTALIWTLTGTRAESSMELLGHHGPVWEVEFSADGRLLASIGGLQEMPEDVVVSWPEHWEVRLWDITAAGPGEWMAVEAAAPVAAFAPDEAHLLAITDTSGVTALDVDTGEAIQTYRVPGMTIRAFAVSPDGQFLLAGGSAPGTGEAGWLAVIDRTSGEPIEQLAPPTADFVPHGIVFNADGSRAAATGVSGVHVWDTGTWDIVFSDTDPGTERIYAAATFSPDGTLLVTQSSPQGEDVATRMTAVWDLGSGEFLTEIGAFPTRDTRAVAFSPDGRLLVTGGAGRPKIYEPYTGRQLGLLDGPATNAHGVAFSPDGSRIATAETDGSVRLWDGTTGEEQLVLWGHRSEVASVAFSPDGSRLVSVGLDGTLLVWALDIDDLVNIAGSRVTRDLTDVECRIWVGEGCAPAPDVERLAPALSEVEGPVGIAAEAWVAAPTAGTWQLREAEIPPFDGAVVYDAHSQAIVGIDTVCGWVGKPGAAGGQDCAPMPPLPVGDEFNPYPSLAAAVYHPGMDRIIAPRTDDGAIFTYDPDTAEWEELQAGGGPFTERYGQGLVYDSDSDLIVLFGGAEWGRIEDGKHVGLTDTWTYDADRNEWTERTPTVSPPGRIDHGVVYDAESDRVIVFGGADVFGGDVMGDTWAYDTDANTWVDMNPAVSPPARAGHAMWYDPVADLVFVFGGSRDWTSWPYLPWDVFGGEELWAYDYESNTWTLMRADPNPGYRVGGRAAFDERAGAAVLAGGSMYDEDRHFRGDALGLWTYRHTDE